MNGNLSTKAKTFSASRLQSALEPLAPGFDEKAAIAAGVTARTVANWRAGKGEPESTQLAALAALTGKPLDFFFEAA